MLVWYATILSFLGSSPLLVAAPHDLRPIEQISRSDAESGLLLEQVYLFEDELSTLSINEIATDGLYREFKVVDHSSMNRIALGISASTWWLRLHLDNKDPYPNAHYLTVDFGLLEEVEIYIPNPEGGFSVQRSGIAVTGGSPSWPGRIPTFRLTDLPDVPILYLRVKSQSPILVPLNIKTESTYFSYELISYLLFGVFFGIMLLVICYNLILSITTGESIYFHYLAYVFFIGVIMLNYFGFSYQYLWPKGSPWIDKVMPASILLAAVTIINFMHRFINTKEHFPTMHRVFIFLIGIYLLLIPVSFFIPTATLFQLLAPTSSIVMLAIVITLIKSYKNDFTPATYILVGWSFLFVGAISLVGKTFGIIPHSQFTSFAILGGTILEVIMFTIGIGYRFRWLNKEAHRMSKELQLKNSELESLREKIANQIMDESPKKAELPVTISKDDINSYLLNELSERELEVLYRVAEGLTNKDIGEHLYISTHTVRAHMRRIYDKLHVKNRTEAVFKANQLQLIKS